MKIFRMKMTGIKIICMKETIIKKKTRKGRKRKRDKSRQIEEKENRNRGKGQGTRTIRKNNRSGLLLQTI